jgi:hypothetical protein
MRVDYDFRFCAAVVSHTRDSVSVGLLVFALFEALRHVSAAIAYLSRAELINIIMHYPSILELPSYIRAANQKLYRPVLRQLLAARRLCCSVGIGDEL